MKRVFLIVLDSVGAGELPDAALFNDTGSNTLKSCYNTGHLVIPNMLDMGIGNIDGLSFLGSRSSQTAACCKLAEKSMGKDTTIGHWEIAGLVSEKPFPTYPNGFPDDVIDEFSRQTGRGVLCNKPYSGTVVINDYGDEHVKTGKLIVYTSADSVFQIAAHEDVVSVETLYEYCRTARKILTGKNAVGRVIARPFVGTSGAYVRTENRKDFSLEPTGRTMLDAISADNKDVVSVGKIADIFAQRGITKAIPAHGNAEAMDGTYELAKTDFEGLAFINLVDFDMLYGHRNNAVGYADALSEFDRWLGKFKELLRPDDILMITADHGCDPATKSTDHSREYIPFLAYGEHVKPVNLGIRSTFSDIAATVCEYLETDFDCPGTSFLQSVIKE